MVNKKYKLFAIGATGTFMATLDISIINVALPTISYDLGCSVSEIAWVALTYSLTLISLMLVFGVWAGKKGYYFAYRFGYIFFFVGSIVCTLSTIFSILLLGRIIQGVGAAMFAAIGPGMVATVFPENERGKGIGMMVMMVSAGFMIGPPLGGMLITYFPWQSIFAINIPIGIIGYIMTVKYFKSMVQTTRDKKINLQSAVSISIALVSFTFFLSMIKDNLIWNINIFLIGAVAVISFGMFLRFETKPETAMIGLNIFKNKQFSSSVAAMLFMFTSLSGIMILIPFYLQQIKHLQPSTVGYYLIILPIMMFIFAPISGRISDKIGYRFLTVTGIIALMAGFYLLSDLQPTTGSFYIVISLVVIGAGVGIFNTPNSSALMGSVTEEYRSVTSSILATTRNIGISLGVALSTSMFTYFQNKNYMLNNKAEIFTTSYQSVIYISICIAFLSLISSIIRTEKKIN